jgi:toxin ParE1/3/4
MAKINWSKLAIKDLQSIYNYISLDSPLYADRHTEHLINAVDLLETHPLSGRIVPEQGNPAIREVIYGNYRIFYKIQRKNIIILRIHHAARKIA